MTDKARELLERALEIINASWYGDFELKEEIRTYLAEPEAKPFARLSEEEIESLANSGLSPNWTDEFELYHFARAIEDALEDKNK